METSLDQIDEIPKSQLRNILIVDDDPLVLDAISMMVTSMGHGYQLATDGEEAVGLFQAQAETIALVIMDVEMPRLGGLEATMKIREINPSAKVILCSGHTKQDVWRVKPSAFLLKPFMHLELRDLIHRFLHQDGSASQ